jgi:diguanylate cyclase (GGDEF)-like protein
MESLSQLIANLTICFLTVVLIVEYVYRKRALRRDADLNRQKQQQLSLLSQELKTLRNELARKGEIADQIPLIAKKMTEILPRGSCATVAVRSVKEFFHAGKAGFFVPIAGSDDYTLEAGAGFPPDWQGNIRVHASDGILGMAIRGKVVLSRNETAEFANRRLSPLSLEGLGVAPDYVAPVFGLSGIAGALVIAGSSVPLEGERKYVSMLADLFSVALRIAALSGSEKSDIWMDPLTGLSSRLHFAKRFEGEIRRTENYGQSLGLFLFDIDEFKKINDTYGHHAGDGVIRNLAGIVRQNTRGSDLVGRYGGDEFMVLLTSTTRERAEAFVEKLRALIGTSEFRIPGSDKPLRITISGGLAMFPAHGQSTPELFRAADDALYEAKRSGRNRIVVARNAGLYGGTSSGSQRDPEDLGGTP